MGKLCCDRCPTRPTQRGCGRSVKRPWFVSKEMSRYERKVCGSFVDYNGRFVVQFCSHTRREIRNGYDIIRRFLCLFDLFESLRKLCLQSSYPLLLVCDVFDSCHFGQDLVERKVTICSERLVGIKVVHRHLLFEWVAVNVVYNRLGTRFVVVRDPWNI